MTQEQFEERFYGKRVRCVGNVHSSAKDFEGIVTAALIMTNEVIFAVMADGYILGETPEKWCTFMTDVSKLDEFLSDFVVL